MHVPSWFLRFPVPYMLWALGCAVVWGVDLLNMGSMGKMMAVATAARPSRTWIASLHTPIIYLAFYPCSSSFSTSTWHMKQVFVVYIFQRLQIMDCAIERSLLMAGSELKVNVPGALAAKYQRLRLRQLFSV